MLESAIRGFFMLLFLFAAIYFMRQVSYDFNKKTRERIKKTIEEMYKKPDQKNNEH